MSLGRKYKRFSRELLDLLSRVRELIKDEGETSRELGRILLSLKSGISEKAYRLKTSIPGSTAATSASINIHRENAAILQNLEQQLLKVIEASKGLKTEKEELKIPFRI